LEPSTEEEWRLDDSQWIQRVELGDEEAALALIRRLYPTIIRSVRRHLPRRTGEEDLTQAIYLKIFKKLNQFSGRVPLEHWVSRIAINTCLNNLRHEVVRPELRMSDLSEEEEIVVQHLATSSEDEIPGDRQFAARDLLDRLMDCLKPDQRLVVTLLHLEERSVAEISRLTGWSESGVKLKAFRARRKMRKLGETLAVDGARWGVAIDH
jgi:RNA polymerase sigma-70 factor (ECF subfamily)